MTTALKIRRIEESLDAVRAIAELSHDDGSAEVHDCVEQARSLLEDLPEPIGVTKLRPRRPRLPRAA